MSLSTNFSSNYQSDADNLSRKINIESPEKNISNGSPSKKHHSQPVMRTPEHKKHFLPEIQLRDFQKPDQVVTDHFKSPVGAISLRARSVKSPSDASNSPISATSPRSPRSPRSEHQTMSSRRHRIDSPKVSGFNQQQTSSLLSSPTLTTTKTVTQTVTTSISASDIAATHGADSKMPVSPNKEDLMHKVARQRLSSPPNTISLNQPSSAQMNALADLWIENLLGYSSHKSSDQAPLLTAAKIASLGRTDGKTAAVSLPQALSDLKISEDKQGNVSLSSLLNSMLANHLGQSVAGKTIKTMLATVMHAHPKLAAIRFDDMINMDDADKENEIRQQMVTAITDQASACVDVAFGPSRKLSESHLPQALLDFWRLLDTRLVKEAAKNPALTAEQILTARKNLGFDLLVTRQMYPFTLKPTQVTLGTEVKPTRVTSDMALPVLVTTFANTMSDKFREAWPTFCADAFANFDA